MQLQVAAGRTHRAEDVADRVDLGRDEPGLAARLHRRLLVLAGRDVGLKVARDLLDEVGGDGAPAGVDVVQVERAGRRRGQDGRAGEVRHAGRELLALDGVCR